jgi:hypothetical protein
MGSAEELLMALSGPGSYRAGAAIASFDDAPEADPAGERVLIAGDHEGGAYLLDPSSLLAADVDVIVDASERLGRPVYGVGAETTSGTYYLIVADAGRLLRCYWDILGALVERYEVGDPLPGEAPDGLDDVDGERLFAVLGAAGFDPEAWRLHGRKLVVDATWESRPEGPAGAALNAFMTAHLQPGSENLRPVVARRDSGFDLVAPGSRLPDGTRVAAPVEKPGLLGRLFGRR